MIVCMILSVFFFFKQKTAYEMRISDWSSDVCSSDLLDGRIGLVDQDFSGVDQLGDVMRRDRGRHADRDPSRAIGEQIGEQAGKDLRLFQIGRASCRERVCQYV